MLSLKASEVPKSTNTAPVPLSFPALLRNPGLTDRYAHLRLGTKERFNNSGFPKASLKKGRRDDNEGKRWIRRKENSKFSGNPHITPASKKDFNVPSPDIQRTFPHPLPPYLSRNTAVPAPRLPAPNPVSANAGRFSLSLKGMRRELRKTGGRTESLVRDVESEILVWLEGGIVLSPGDKGDGELRFPGMNVRGREDLREVGRSILQLVWATDDAFVRYVVHCCARYHDIVSYSKDTDSHRLTYLLRPNVTRPDRHAQATLDTPPATDLDYASHEHESDFISEPPSGSDIDVDSDAEGIHATAAEAGTGLAAIQESPVSRVEPLEPDTDEAWSIVGDTDAEGDESSSEHGLVASVDSLSMQDSIAEPALDVNSAPRAIATASLRHHSSLRPRVWDHRQGRSASSPSRSPSRRPPRRVHPRIEPPKGMNAHPKSFYDYLYT